MIEAVGLTFFLRSWRTGVWRKEHKTLYALGPFRLVLYRDVGAWKG